MFIKEAKANIISNSRKEDSIEVKITTYEGTYKASAPSGKSRGIHEVEPYNMLGITKSKELLEHYLRTKKHTNIIIKKVQDLKKVEEELHKFEEQHGRLGGNTWYALETALLKAAAADRGKELWELIRESQEQKKKIIMPMPVGNCIGGGLHSEPIRNKRPDFQEFLLIPKETTFHDAVSKNMKAYYKARKLLKTKKRNDENALRTNKTNEEVLQTLRTIADEYNLRIGLDIAASTFYQEKHYHYKNKEYPRTRKEQLTYIEHLINTYRIYYAEDPMEEEDFQGYKELNKKRKKKTLIVGDDLTTTNKQRLQRAIRTKAINAIIIKPNQIGKLTEVQEVVNLCKKHKITMIFSHRSGETMDNALADYAIGFGAEHIKTGIYGKERLIKLKRIVDIEKKILKKEKLQ